MSLIEKAVNTATLVAGLSALVVAGAVVRRQSQPPASAAGVGSAASNGRVSREIPNWRTYEAGGHRFGPVNAKVTIIEFGDYECPACAAFAKVSNAVMPRHAGDVALIFRHWPLSYHRFAYPAARAAECAADQGRFEAYHDLLYAKRDSLGLLSFSDLAERAHVPEQARFAACSKGRTPVAAIDSGIAAAKRLQAWGTPALIVNGVLLAGVPDSADLESLIRESHGK